jgi:hypothetical protein
MVKPTPMRSALSVRELALLSLSGDFLGNRAICLALFAECRGKDTHYIFICQINWRKNAKGVSGWF